MFSPFENNTLVFIFPIPSALGNLFVSPSFFSASQAAQAYADNNNCLFMETSAKTNENVSELFVEIAKKLPKTQAPKAAVHSTLSLQATVPEDGTDQGGSKCKC